MTELRHIINEPFNPYVLYYMYFFTMYILIGARRFSVLECKAQTHKEWLINVLEFHIDI